MNEEQLKALNLEEAQVNSVIKLHKEAIDGNYVTKSRFNEVNDELGRYKDDIKTRDDQLEELRKLDPEKLQERITELQKDNETQKEEFEKEMQKLKINHALESQLSKAKVRNTKAVSALLKLDEAELDDNGEIKGLEEQIKALQESDAYLFDLEEEKKSKFKGTQPGSPGDKNPTPLDISKMTYAEFEEYMESQNKQ